MKTTMKRGLTAITVHPIVGPRPARFFHSRERPASEYVALSGHVRPADVPPFRFPPGQIT
jgi:hypothetical protein